MFRVDNARCEFCLNMISKIYWLSTCHKEKEMSSLFYSIGSFEDCSSSTELQNKAINGFKFLAMLGTWAVVTQLFSSNYQVTRKDWRRLSLFVIKFTSQSIWHEIVETQRSIPYMSLSFNRLTTLKIVMCAVLHDHNKCISRILLVWKQKFAALPIDYLNWKGDRQKTLSRWS